MGSSRKKSGKYCLGIPLRTLAIVVGIVGILWYTFQLFMELFYFLRVQDGMQTKVGPVVLNILFYLMAVALNTALILGAVYSNWKLILAWLIGMPLLYVGHAAYNIFNYSDRLAVLSSGNGLSANQSSSRYGYNEDSQAYDCVEEFSTFTTANPLINVINKEKGNQRAGMDSNFRPAMTKITKKIVVPGVNLEEDAYANIAKEETISSSSKLPEEVILLPNTQSHQSVPSAPQTNVDGSTLQVKTSSESGASSSPALGIDSFSTLPQSSVVRNTQQQAIPVIKAQVADFNTNPQEIPLAPTAFVIQSDAVKAYSGKNCTTLKESMSREESSAIWHPLNWLMLLAQILGFLLIGLFWPLLYKYMKYLKRRREHPNEDYVSKKLPGECYELPRSEKVCRDYTVRSMCSDEKLPVQQTTRGGRDCSCN